MKRVLVTGATGFIGRQTLQPLLKRGFEVHAVARRAGSTDSVCWHTVDLADAVQIDALLTQLAPTHLLHGAWYAEHGRFWSATENFQWVGTTLHLLKAFHNAGGQRAIAVGSCAEYDLRHGYCDEALTPLVPTSVYGICKNATRALFEAYCQQAGVSAAWARVFHLYGPHEHPARLVSSICIALLEGRQAACSHGRQLRNFLHVADVADALAAVLDSPLQGVINIGAPEAVTIGKLAERLARQAGRPELLCLGARPAPADEPPLVIPATRRLTEELGWQPGYDLEHGLRAVLEWWEASLRGVPPRQGR
jgi:nucleoside-diphosphate-sugar epimerase